MDELSAFDLEGKKEAARGFLDGLRRHLNGRISSQTVNQWIREKGHVVNEQLFLEEFVLPAIPEYLGQNIDPLQLANATNAVAKLS